MFIIKDAESKSDSDFEFSDKFFTNDRLSISFARTTLVYIFFLSSLSLQVIGFAILCLLEVRYRFRVQIFANTLLSVQRRSGGGTPSQNLGSPQICPQQIFAYWYSRSAFILRFSPFLRFRVLSMIFTTSSRRCLISTFYCYTAIVYLVKLLLTRKGTQVSTLFIEAEYVKYE